MKHAEEPQQNDYWDRNADQPKEDAAHGAFSLFDNVLKQKRDEGAGVPKLVCFGVLLLDRVPGWKARLKPAE